MSRASSRSRYGEKFTQALLVLGSILLCLILLELGFRLARGPQWLVEWPNLVREQRVSIRNYANPKASFDPVLGFVGKPNFEAPGFHYDAKGFRRTAAPAGMILKEPPILAVGGSYTLGEEVADDETYPAQLQALIGRRVINAGMDAYGFDQAVLRAEIVAAQERPAAIVLGFGTDNLRRSEMSRVWGVEKPYFELVGGNLVLRNVPVPPSPDPATTLDFWQRLFGRSVLVDFVLRRLMWQYEWSIDHVRVLPRGDGARLACPLLKRLAGLKLPVIVIAEYDPYLWTDPPYMKEQRQLTDSVLHCAADSGIVTVDPFPEIDESMRTSGRDVLYRKGEHPSPAGQALTAKLVAEALAHLKLP
jgi:hypothetical protein